MKSCHGCWYVTGRVYAEKHVFLQYTGERVSRAFYASKSGALGRCAATDSGGVTCTLRKTTGQAAGPGIGGVGATVGRGGGGIQDARVGKVGGTNTHAQAGNVFGGEQCASPE